ncbi:MAG TPA: prolipoprotein diacylglyceryl transferase family protein [Kofleriaceae bacterium]|nr:prolipoprotein diacylglyceryl transferase family protein [Kofleriaceae bacterium]
MRPYVVHWLERLVPGGAASALAPTWFTCVGLAGVVALFAMLAIARRHRIDRGAVAGIVLWGYVAAVTAGIAIPSAIDAADQLFTTGRVQIRWAGMTSFWGFFAGGCAIAAACRAHGVAVRRFADLAVAPLGIALMLARIGCFLAGCDYGKVSALPWAVRFPAHSPAWQDHVATGLVPIDRTESLAVHPTELYEAGLGLALVVLALGLARRRRDDGRVFLIAAAVYAIGRIGIEELRGDAGRGIYLGLSSGQIFSLIVLAAIAAGIWLRRVRPLAAAGTIASAALTLALAVSHAGAEPAPAPSPPPTAPPRSPRAAAPAPRAPSQPFGPQRSPAQPPPAQPARRAGPPEAAPAPGGPSQPFGPQLPSAPPAQPPPAQPPPAPAAPPPLYTPTLAPAQPGGSGVAAAAPPAPAERSGGSTLSFGVLVGGAAVFNRRPEQVPPLTGASASIGFGYRQLGVWLDFDSFANRDARHGTVLASGGASFPIASRLVIGGRVGIGATLVNFNDPAFRDVVGTTGRFEAVVDVRLGDSWVLWIRPLALDVLSAADLGGPIASWQARLGLAYRVSFGRRATAIPAAPSPAQPAPYPPPAPPAGSPPAAPQSPPPRSP